ncbi:pyrimidine dimer DNA glycosylase/endonuclease V [Candidatus Nesciobacter abundans]|uniref:DNA lyase n=1 Tax=Candidatus Nesciobacter abundans TaxID=2601668 RepID=A0A5C0UGG1_9PROT|nr:pyrimidine dimer DNA glycosylase/endonuclease V [Candidatus Nesciobacter abundans]QEK39205.1 hypothetical protein FZC36_02085 [Candidatus Nesciobacter abundans]
MRIWSIEPKYLDSKGLIALWRESLLAQNVLFGHTKGYKHHPQLIRFKEHKNPTQAMSKYLHYVSEEARNRSYNFNASKIKHELDSIIDIDLITVSTKQIQYEWSHLLHKIKNRDCTHYEKIKQIKEVEPNPLFKIVSGEIEKWEKIA